MVTRATLVHQNMWTFKVILAEIMVQIVGILVLMRMRRIMISFITPFIALMTWSHVMHNKKCNIGNKH